MSAAGKKLMNHEDTKDTKIVRILKNLVIFVSSWFKLLRLCRV
jgi:hypothetical protein